MRRRKKREGDDHMPPLDPQLIFSSIAEHPVLWFYGLIAVLLMSTGAATWYWLLAQRLSPEEKQIMETFYALFPEEYQHRIVFETLEAEFENEGKGG
jgi:hypothetical protein